MPITIFNIILHHYRCRYLLATNTFHKFRKEETLKRTQLVFKECTLSPTFQCHLKSKKKMKSWKMFKLQILSLRPRVRRWLMLQSLHQSTRSKYSKDFGQRPQRTTITSYPKLTGQIFRIPNASLSMLRSASIILWQQRCTHFQNLIIWRLSKMTLMIKWEPS